MYNPMSLEGKRILVTGASSGIGRSCALIASRLGACLVITGRNDDRLQETLRSLDGANHKAVLFDLNNLDEISGWLKTLALEVGAFDGVIHSAGVAITRPIKSTKLADYSWLMRTNVDTAYALAKGFRQKGVCKKPGSIVLLSSIAGNVGSIGLSAYCASKSALQGMARSLALELARDDIRVNCISPGHVQTEMAVAQANTLTPEQSDKIIAMHPLGLGEPEDVAHAAAFLLSGAGRWITGTNFIVDGGYTAH
jgi:NAD(P)-dependent dehydrogenase (short-subunit alcohol dehydrogenase family)